MRILLLLSTLCAISLAALTGCPPESKREPAKSDTAVCSKVGQTCEYSPGKLGTCVQKDDCPQGQTCFTCQSQH